MFAQRPNLTKTEENDEPQVFFDCLTSDEITVLDANLVSDEIIEIRYENGDKLVQPNPNTNVVIAAFTTAHAQLQLYDELDMLQKRVLYYDTDSVIYLSQPGQPEPRLGNYIGDLTDELGGNTSRYSRRAGRRITATKPVAEKPKSKYVKLRWIERPDKRSTLR